MLEKGGARRGGMPLYKFVGNRILSWFQNRMLGASLSEFHSGYRVYSVAALQTVPFELNTNDFHFDTEIIIQFLLAGQQIVELPIPTYYGDEICRVNGMKYALGRHQGGAASHVAAARAALRPPLRCRRRQAANAQYEPKLDYPSPHSAALELVPAGARVLDLGCAGGYVGAMLRRRRGCRVTGVDKFPLGLASSSIGSSSTTSTTASRRSTLADFDYVLMLDVIEHLSAPEAFIEQLRDGAQLLLRRRSCSSAPATSASVVNRLMLLLGQFNYGKRGILDLTHTRLFTFASFRRLFEQGGFRVVETRGIPGPFPLAIRNAALSRFVLRMNQWLIAICRASSPTRCSSSSSRCRRWSTCSRKRTSSRPCSTTLRDVAPCSAKPSGERMALG